MKKNMVLILLISTGLQATRTHRACPQPQSFKERLQVAAQWLKDCPAIIEIGGGLNPISSYLNKEQKLIVVDPILNKGIGKGNVVYIRDNFENCNEIQPFIKENPRYAVVLMGLQLGHVSDAGWKTLYELINESEKTIIEYSASFKKAKQQYKSIRKNCNKEVTLQQDFDYSRSNFKNYKNVYPFRRMLCLTTKK